jgi:hypothetical protein
MARERFVPTIRGSEGTGQSLQPADLDDFKAK